MNIKTILLFFYIESCLNIRPRLFCLCSVWRRTAATGTVASSRHIEATWTVDTKLFLGGLKPIQNGKILVGLSENLGRLSLKKISRYARNFSPTIFQK